jgi:hypothetical protein
MRRPTPPPHARRRSWPQPRPWPRSRRWSRPAWSPAINFCSYQGGKRDGMTVRPSLFVAPAGLFASMQSSAAARPRLPPTSPRGRLQRQLGGRPTRMCSAQVCNFAYVQSGGDRLRRSVATLTGWPRSSARRGATGLRRNLSSGPDFGRPWGGAQPRVRRGRAGRGGVRGAGRADATYMGAESQCRRGRGCARPSHPCASCER